MIKCDVFVNQCREETIPCCQGKRVPNCLFSSGWPSFQFTVRADHYRMNISQWIQLGTMRPLRTTSGFLWSWGDCSLGIHRWMFILIWISAHHLSSSRHIFQTWCRIGSLLPFLSYQTYCFLHLSKQKFLHRVLIYFSALSHCFLSYPLCVSTEAE